MPPRTARPSAHSTSKSDAPRRARRGSGAVTLHDVARLAGVAPITASRAINTPAQVSDDVRQRVADAVAKTGYVPNLLAGGLASTRSRLVAAIVPTIIGPVFTPTIAALTQALAAEGYQLMLGQSGYPSADGGNREDPLLEAIIGRRPDGLVVAGVMHSAQGRQRLLAAGIPVVETWDLTTTPIDMLVGFSHDEVGRAVTNYLHARGHRRLACIAGSDERAARRARAFAAAAQGLRLPEVTVVTVPAPTTLRAGREALGNLLMLRSEVADRSTKRRSLVAARSSLSLEAKVKAEVRAGTSASSARAAGTKTADASVATVDAVFCSSDLLALGVLTEARARGLDIPRDMAVVGFGDLDFAADTLPALTTVRIDGQAIGRQAARFIVERAQGRAVEPRVVDIGFSIVERDSA